MRCQNDHDESLYSKVIADSTSLLVKADRCMIEQHLSWLATPACKIDPNLRLEIAWGKPDAGPNCAATFRVDDVNLAADLAVRLNSAGFNLYVGATLKAVDTPEHGRTQAGHAVLAVCLPVDLDGDFSSGLQKLESIAKADVIVTTGTIPEPRGQAWIKIIPSQNIGLWKEINRRAVYFCGGDKNALGSYRLMRLGGSVSYPSPSKQTRGYATELTVFNYCHAPVYKLEELIESFPATSDDKSSRPKCILRKKAQRRLIPINQTNVAIVQSMLDALPERYAFEYDLWMRVAFAIHDFDDGDIGLLLWKKFSERAPDKFTATDFDKRWDYLSRSYRGPEITIGSLIFEAKKHGWNWPCCLDLSIDGVYEGTI